jgi:hypothetical protein
MLSGIYASSASVILVQVRNAHIHELSQFATFTFERNPHLQFLCESAKVAHPDGRIRFELEDDQPAVAGDTKNFGAVARSVSRWGRLVLVRFFDVVEMDGTFARRSMSRRGRFSCHSIPLLGDPTKQVGELLFLVDRVTTRRSFLYEENGAGGHCYHDHYQGPNWDEPNFAF